MLSGVRKADTVFFRDKLEATAVGGSKFMGFYCISY